MLARVTILFAQLLLVAASVFIADAAKDVVDFIPRWLIRLPEVTYSASDFWTVLAYFVATHAVVLGLAQLVAGPWRPADTRRTVDELFALAAAFAASALLVFVTTTVAFDPQFVVGIAVTVAVLTVLVHLVVRGTRGTLLSVPGQLLGALLRRTFSIPGILILVFALSPGVLAKLFVSNRDVANVITQIRISLASGGDRDWELVNAFGDITFAQPMLVQFPPHRSDQAYVLERSGRVLRMPWGATGEPEVILDLSTRVGFVDVENGALGFDFHPEFGRSEGPAGSTIYLYYTSVHDGSQVNRLSAFSLAGESVAERSASERELIVWDRPDDGFHNGGSVEFGPDGFLYLAVGEMSNVDSHQRIDRALTSGILRIDVDNRGAPVSGPIRRQPVDGTSTGYSIPLDNPFADGEDALGEYWALGLRNPFRVSFDPATGELWAGDVGSTVWEEVNVVRKGHNYQYPFVEGNEPTRVPRPEQVQGTESGPVYTYRHTAYDRAVIGGIVYRGTRHGALDGQYLFGDNYSGMLWSTPATDAPRDTVAEIAQAGQFAQRGISSITQSPDGRILVTTLGKAGAATGQVLELVPASEATASAGGTTTGAPETVTPEEIATLYQTNCSRCHGTGGAGDGPDAEHMNVPMPDMRAGGFHADRSDDDLYRVVAEGGAALGLSPMMPPWAKLLSEAELRAMVGYLRGLEAR